MEWSKTKAVLGIGLVLGAMLLGVTMYCGIFYLRL